MSAVTGLTLWAVLLLGVAATGTGALTRVPLAVLTLTALAAFEAVTALPAAAVQLGQARVAAGRIAAVTDTPDPVRDPGRPRALPPGPFGIQLRDATVRYRPDGPPALDRVSLDLPPGRRVALVGANGAGKSTVAAVLMRFCATSAAEPSCSTATTWPATRPTTCGRSSAGARRIRTCSTPPSATTCGSPAPMPPTRNSRPPRPAPGCCRGSGLCRGAGTPRSAPTGRPSPAASGSGWRWPARSWPTRRLLILDEPTAHLDPATRRALTADLLHATEGRSVLLITHEPDGARPG